MRTIMVGMERTRPDIRPAELAAQLRVAVWRAARRMRHVSDVEITPTLHAALRSVERHGPVTAGQLARFEHVQKPSITRTIRELVDRGLIERLPDRSTVGSRGSRPRRPVRRCCTRRAGGPTRT